MLMHTIYLHDQLTHRPLGQVVPRRTEGHQHVGVEDVVSKADEGDEANMQQHLEHQVIYGIEHQEKQRVECHINQHHQTSDKNSSTHAARASCCRDAPEANPPELVVA